MKFAKRVIQHTFLYEPFQRFQMTWALRNWTRHDQAMLDFYSEFVSPGSLCFDVGANIGKRTKIFLRLQARVVAVEPQDECVRILRAVYGGERRLTIVHSALGESEGRAEIMISDANTLSSLSPEWIRAVTESGRFSMYRWGEKRVITVTTLDSLIEQYGTPSFVKIDVEGFESQVIKGLSRPIRALSLEFAQEFIESTFNCLGHLDRLGDFRANYSVGETMRLALDRWATHTEMVGILSSWRNDQRLWGDVYVRFL